MRSTQVVDNDMAASSSAFHEPGNTTVLDMRHHMGCGCKSLANGTLLSADGALVYYFLHEIMNDAVTSRA